MTAAEDTPARLAVLGDRLLDLGVDPVIVAALVEHGDDLDRPYLAWEALVCAWERALGGDAACDRMMAGLLTVPARAARSQVACGLLAYWATGEELGGLGIGLRTLAHRVLLRIDRGDQLGADLLAPTRAHAARSGPVALWPRALRAVRGVLARLDLWSPSPVASSEIAWACPVCGGPLLWHVTDTRGEAGPRPAQAHCISGAWSSLSAEIAVEDVCPWGGARCVTDHTPTGIRWAGGAS